MNSVSDIIHTSVTYE